MCCRLSRTISRSAIRFTKHHDHFRNVFTSTWAIVRWVSSFPYTFKKRRAHKRCTGLEEIGRKRPNRHYASEQTFGVVPNCARKREHSVRTPKTGLFRIISPTISAKREGEIYIFSGNSVIADKTTHGMDCGLHSRTYIWDEEVCWNCMKRQKSKGYKNKGFRAKYTTKFLILASPRRARTTFETIVFAYLCMANVFLLLLGGYITLLQYSRGNTVSRRYRKGIQYISSYGWEDVEEA